MTTWQFSKWLDELVEMMKECLNKMPTGARMRALQTCACNLSLDLSLYIYIYVQQVHANVAWHNEAMAYNVAATWRWHT